MLQKLIKGAKVKMPNESMDQCHVYQQFYNCVSSGYHPIIHIHWLMYHIEQKTFEERSAILSGKDKRRSHIRHCQWKRHTHVSGQDILMSVEKTVCPLFRSFFYVFLDNVQHMPQDALPPQGCGV